MISRIFSAALVAVVACTSDDLRKDTAAVAVAHAALYCDYQPGQMQWLRTLIEQSEKDVTLKGTIYVFEFNGQPIFIHQPWISSCFGCILYDCDGNRLANSSISHSIPATGFDDLVVIYDPLME